MSIGRIHAANLPRGYATTLQSIVRPGAPGRMKHLLYNERRDVRSRRTKVKIGVTARGENSQEYTKDPSSDGHS